MGGTGIGAALGLGAEVGATLRLGTGIQGQFWGWALGLGPLWDWMPHGFVLFPQGSRVPHQRGPVWANLQVSCSGLC